MGSNFQQDGSGSRDARLPAPSRAPGREIWLFRNRRLFDQGQGRFITQRDLLALLDQGVSFHVWDRKTRNDITVAILWKLMCLRETERPQGQQCCTEQFLHEFLRLPASTETTLRRAFLDHTMQTLLAHGEG